MKKILSSVLAAQLLLASAVIPVLADGDISVYVDGEALKFDVPPVIENDRTLVPMRAIFEALGAKIEWDGETRTVTAGRGDDVLSITIGSDKLYKNDSPVALDAPARIINDRTLVPIRAISESFDAVVDWDAASRSVIISTQTAAEADITPAPANSTAPAEEVSDRPDLPMLTEDDLKTLVSMKNLIRYDFEQSALPEYVLGSEDMYESMEYGSKEELLDLASRFYEQWTRTGAKYIIQIMTDSEHEYTIGAVSEDELLSGMEEILKAAQLDSESVIEGTAPFETDSGTRIAVVIFKTANELVDCKFLGIAASKDGKTRYFTAENDIMQPELWFLCEVTEDGRGTIGTFAKDENDLESFVRFAAGVYEDNSGPVISQPKILSE